jgi:hypothetical protein
MDIISREDDNVNNNLEEIGRYHKEVFGDQISVYAWGGLLFEEIKTGLWMDIYIKNEGRHNLVAAVIQTVEVGAKEWVSSGLHSDYSIERMTQTMLYTAGRASGNNFTGDSTAFSKEGVAKSWGVDVSQVVLLDPYVGVHNAVVPFSKFIIKPANPHISTPTSSVITTPAPVNDTIENKVNEESLVNKKVGVESSFQTAPVLKDKASSSSDTVTISVDPSLASGEARILTFENDTEMKRYLSEAKAKTGSSKESIAAKVRAAIESYKEKFNSLIDKFLKKDTEECEKETSESKGDLQSEANKEIDAIQSSLNAECSAFCTAKDLEYSARAARFKESYDGEHNMTINNDKENAEKTAFCASKGAKAVASVATISSRVTSQISEDSAAIQSRHKAERKEKHDSTLAILNQNVQHFADIFNAVNGDAATSQTEELINQTIESHLAGMSHDLGLDSF